MDTPFGLVRKAAIQQWRDGTGRTTGRSLKRTYECAWQNRNDTGAHVNAFCSLADFGTHITDLLKDGRFDSYGFDEPRSDRLFRHYTLILLIASELLTDFQDMYAVATTGKVLAELDREQRRKVSNAARAAFSTSAMDANA